MSAEAFREKIENSYTFEGDSITLGGAMLDKEVLGGCHVKAPLSMFNRHGLIAGATGTGKTKSLQVLAEHLSENGVPSLLMDMKGDLSGLAQPSPGHRKIDERHQAIQLPFHPAGFPLEFLSLSNEQGLRLRATMTEFGPILFSKILNLNSTQESVVSLVFKYCDDNAYPLIDLEDFKKTLLWMTNEGKAEVQADYGRISTATVGAIIRKIIGLEQQGAAEFFGEPSFEVDDFCRINDEGKGIISVVRLTDIQDKPHLFSTFMLQLLAEIYSSFPEEGDLDRPKLVLFIDEAHLIFDKASDALLDQLNAIIKLIRSKGVGIFFITQNPTDIPDDVLSQLGMKIQHALRAFTAKDRKAIKLAAQNFPLSDHYDIDQMLTELGIGEALITVLNEDGIPTELAHTMMRAPQSRMDILSPEEINYVCRNSRLLSKYDRAVDRVSAEEILAEKIEIAQAQERQEELRKEREKLERSSQRSRRRPGRPRQTILEKTMNQASRTVARELTRGLLGVLGIGGKRKRRWF